MVKNQSYFIICWMYIFYDDICVSVNGCLDLIKLIRNKQNNRFQYIEIELVSLNNEKTALIYSEKYLLHDPGPRHPEVPSRLRVIIRDLVTQDPLNKPGDKGFLEVLTPFGVAASVNHAITVNDLVEIVAKHKCPECGYEGDTFLVHGRIVDQKGLGCSSILEWI